MQEDVYEGTTRALVQRVVRGGNATVLAYGATGSGKTYTMVGTAQEPGVMVRVLDDLFREATQLQDPGVRIMCKQRTQNVKQNMKKGLYIDHSLCIATLTK